MVNVVNPRLANGRTMFINKSTGVPAPSRRGGVVSVRPGLNTVTLYNAKHIPDIGLLIIMSDGNRTRFYLFTGAYRGTVLSEHHSVDFGDALEVLVDVLEEPRSQGIGDFKRRIWKWLAKETNRV